MAMTVEMVLHGAGMYVIGVHVDVESVLLGAKVCQSF